MGIEQALAAIEECLNHELSDLQQLILRHSGQGKTYGEIATECGYSPDYIREHGAKLWQILSNTFQTKITKKNWRRILQEYEFTDARHRLTNRRSSEQDWLGAIDVSSFCGREQEIATLKRWTTEERCRLVGILGIGGVGKTSLAIKLGQQVADDFDYLIWRSLKNAPRIEQILIDLIQLISEFQDIELNSALEIEANIAQLMSYLQSHRCLLILDNLESILQNDVNCGEYKRGYQDYGKLFQCVGEISHQSCLIVTSREKPQELIALSGTRLPVRSLQLSGLDLNSSKAIFDLKGYFFASESDWQALNENYRGNPLALKIIATTISELFDGCVNSFLQQDVLLFDDLEHLLAEQFKRLSQLEKDIMYWLAVEREAVALSQLQQDLLTSYSQRKLLEATKSLLRRSLIEKTPNGFSQQPVVMEYAIAQMLKQVTEEIETAKPNLLVSHALVKAETLEYLRRIQNRTTLKLLVHNLTQVNHPSALQERLEQIIDNLRGKTATETGYAVGNIINLLQQLKIDLSNFDFAQTHIRQAYLQNINLHNVKLTHADIRESVFSPSLDLVFAIAFNPQGTVLATGSFTGEIYLWEMPQARQMLCFSAHENWVQSLVFTDDGNTLVSSSYDGTVKLWDTATGRCLQVLTENSAPIADLAWSAAGLSSTIEDKFKHGNRILAQGSHDGTVKLWDAQTWQCLDTYPLDLSIFSIAVDCGHQCGRTLNCMACGELNGTIQILDVSTGECLKTLKGHQDMVNGVIFSGEGSQLLSSSFDGTIKYWDLSTGECLKTLTGHQNKVSYLALSPDRTIIASSSYDRMIRLWDKDTGKCLKVLQGHEDTIWAIAFSPDGQTIASGSLDSSIKFWDVNTGELTKNLQGYQRSIWSVVFSPDGQTIASGSGDRTVSLWDIKTGNCHQTWQAHDHQVSAVAYSPNGEFLASSSSKGKVKLWRVDTRECIYSYDRHHDWVWGLAFSPDGTIIASGGHDCLVNLWDVATGKHLATFKDNNVIWSVAFSPDGSLLASGNYDCEIKLWNIKARQLTRTLTGHQGYINSVVFSPENDLLASAGYDASIKLWDVNSGECVATLREHTNIIWSIAFSADGSLLASAGNDRTIELWDVKSRKCINSFTDTSYRIDAIAFCPNNLLSNRSQILASSSQDGLIKLWQINTGECIKVIRPTRLYESMDITGIKGLTVAQKETLKVLGAVDKN